MDGRFWMNNFLHQCDTPLWYAHWAVWCQQLGPAKYLTAVHLCVHINITCLRSPPAFGRLRSQGLQIKLSRSGDTGTIPAADPTVAPVPHALRYGWNTSGMEHCMPSHPGELRSVTYTHVCSVPMCLLLCSVHGDGRVTLSSGAPGTR